MILLSVLSNLHYFGTLAYQFKQRRESYH